MEWIVLVSIGLLAGGDRVPWSVWGRCDHRPCIDLLRDIHHLDRWDESADSCGYLPCHNDLYRAVVDTCLFKA